LTRLVTFFIIQKIREKIMDLKHDIREIFRKYMYENDINQLELSEKLGISRTTVSRIMNKRVSLSFKILEEYCRRLNIDIELKEKE
jgi:transcriptional regulator with XRE-family HTH domain